MKLVPFVLAGSLVVLAACSSDEDALFDPAGDTDGGSDAAGGTAGNGGSSGASGSTGGSGGAAGTSGSGGTAGTSGSGGAAGTSGSGGAAGTSGSGGAAGTSGSGGAAGTSGSGGTAGTGGSSGGPLGNDECDRTMFVYAHEEAQYVWVTGSFTKPTPWAKNPAEGAIELIPRGHGIWNRVVQFDGTGRHLYKFIVDGYSLWQHDPWNPQKESDGQGGYNSVVNHWHAFLYWYPHPPPAQVFLTGSFTTPIPWATSIVEGMLPLQAPTSLDLHWLSVELPTGHQAYKFSDDGSCVWSPDPSNPQQEPDGLGGFNSYVTVCREH